MRSAPGYTAAATAVTEGTATNNCCGPQEPKSTSPSDPTLYATDEREPFPAEAIAISLGQRDPTAIAELRDRLAGPGPRLWPRQTSTRGADHERRLVLQPHLVILVVQVVDLVVTDEDLDAWVAGLEELFAGVAGRFYRVEPRRRARAYVRGLLAPLAGKNGWTLAEAAGDLTPDGMQRLLNAAAWDAHGMRDDLRDYAVGHLGERDGVLIVDETRPSSSRRVAVPPVCNASTPAPPDASRTASSVCFVLTRHAKVAR